MRRPGSLIRSAIIPAGVVLALVASNANLAGQDNGLRESPVFQTGVGTHESRTESVPAPEVPEASEMQAQAQFEMPAPTRSTFMAQWDSVTGAAGYLLDVSTSDSFTSYVDGYHDLDVGNVIGRSVTGLSSGRTYYYRVRPYDATGPGSYSEVMTVTTVATVGLVIHPTFDASITGNQNAAAIEAMINRAISIYESLFSDPVTIQILFRYSTTGPDGTPLPMNRISQSNYVYYPVLWGTFINALRADVSTGNDSRANAALPAAALSTNVNVQSANGRAVGLNTPPDMNGQGGLGGPYDGIVTINSGVPFQFSRPVSAGNFDAQRLTEHEIDEVIGFGSRLSSQNPNGDLWPQDLFSWSSAGHRNITASSSRYFSINGGVSNLVSFNQSPSGDFGDWLSTACPQTHPYVQNAFSCTGQSSDISATSPEGINLDVIGYDLVGAPPALATDFDFNSDGHPDYLLYDSSTQQTVVAYLNNNVFVGAAFGPTLPAGWSLVATGDFNRDGHPDWLLFNPATLRTVIWYMNNNVHVTGANGPTLPAGWQVVAVADFNGDGHPDWLLFNPATRRTVIWYMNRNVHVTGANGPTLPAGWEVVAVADFNRDGHADWLLFNPPARHTVIWYMNRNVHVTGANGPTLPAGWSVIGAADFNGDGKPDYLLFNASTLRTVIWYMNNNVHVTGASGPTLPAGWSLVAP